MQSILIAVVILVISDFAKKYILDPWYKQYEDFSTLKRDIIRICFFVRINIHHEYQINWKPVAIEISEISVSLRVNAGRFPFFSERNDYIKASDILYKLSRSLDDTNHVPSDFLDIIQSIENILKIKFYFSNLDYLPLITHK